MSTTKLRSAYGGVVAVGGLLLLSSPAHAIIQEGPATCPSGFRRVCHFSSDHTRYICHCERDGDDDRDGVLNLRDNCPRISNPNQADCDKDRTGDACDAANETILESHKEWSAWVGPNPLFEQCYTNGSGRLDAHIPWVWTRDRFRVEDVQFCGPAGNNRQKRTFWEAGELWACYQPQNRSCLNPPPFNPGPPPGNVCL